MNSYIYNSTTNNLFPNPLSLSTPTIHHYSHHLLNNDHRHGGRSGRLLPAHLLLPPPAAPAMPAPPHLRPPSPRHRLVVVQLGGGAVAPGGAAVAARGATVAPGGVALARRARGAACRARRAPAPPARARGPAAARPPLRASRGRAFRCGAHAAAQAGAGGGGRGDEGGGGGRREDEGGVPQGRRERRWRYDEQAEDAEDGVRGRGRARDAGERRRGPLVLARIRGAELFYITSLSILGFFRISLQVQASLVYHSNRR
jgi:hypothetical protein